MMKDYFTERYGRIKLVARIGGPALVVKKVVLGGMLKPAVNGLNYYRKKKKYPQNVIFIAGFPKSGSTWFARMLAGLDGFDPFTPRRWATKPAKQWKPAHDLYPGIFEEFAHRLAVVKGHTWGTKDNVALLRASGLRYFVTVRDPRDQIISSYWFIRSRPLHREWELAQSLSLEEYITHKLASGVYEREELAWLRSWISRLDEDQVALIKYEDLLADTTQMMRLACAHLNFACRDEEIRAIVERNSFARLAGRPRGVEDRSSFVRKGVAGEWRTVFSEVQKQQFVRIGEDVIAQFGYAPTLSSLTV
ncbi:sulfotransferase domain-containing protein [Rhodocaloribacter sp.]